MKLSKLLSRAALCVMFILAGIVCIHRVVSAGEVKETEKTPYTSASKEDEVQI